MDRSYPYSRRQVSRARLRKRLAAMAATGVAGAAVLVMLMWKPDPISASLPAAAPTAALAAADAQPGGVRRIYPYSVIPGGVSGKTELARVIRTDRVVAAHYASFDVDKARPVVVGKPRAVHVSYRKGGKVYWTARKVMLAEGETLLSDGRNEMRARCANRISDVPQYPVEAHQPEMEELDNPVEVDEGGQYTLGPDGLPVSMSDADGVPQHVAQHFPAGGSGGFAAAPGGAPAAATPAGSSYSPRPAQTGLADISGLSGSSSSWGSRPWPATTPAESPGASPAPDSPSGPDGSGSASGAPAPSGVAADSRVASPLPPAVPVPSAGPENAPQPDLPGPTPLPGPPPALTPDLPPLPPLLPAPPSTDTEPFIPKPELVPTPPLRDSEQPKPPANVPEPGSAWLFGTTLTALAVLRRRRKPLSPES